MYWKDTLIESEQIIWKGIKPRNTEDGKLDFSLNLHLSPIFEAQAKQSFCQGMLTMLEFLKQKQLDKEPIKAADLVKLFNDCGLPKIARQFKEAHGY